MFNLTSKPASQQNVQHNPQTAGSISTPWHQSVKTLSVAFSPCWPPPCLVRGVCVCVEGRGVSPCRFTAVLLNSEWLSHGGQVQLCVYDSAGVRVKLYYVCLCACGAGRQMTAGTYRLNRLNVETLSTSEVDQLEPVGSWDGFFKYKLLTDLLLPTLIVFIQ